MVYHGPIQKPEQNNQSTGLETLDSLRSVAKIEGDILNLADQIRQVTPKQLRYAIREVGLIDRAMKLAELFKNQYLEVPGVHVYVEDGEVIIHSGRTSYQGNPMGLLNPAHLARFPTDPDSRLSVYSVNGHGHEIDASGNIRSLAIGRRDEESQEPQCSPVDCFASEISYLANRAIQEAELQELSYMVA